MNNGRESEIVADFVRWLEADGWTVTTEVDWVDIVAERRGVKLLGEAKGVTAAPGLDSDTMMGQLLRRMTDEDETIRYAAIVPWKSYPPWSEFQPECGDCYGSKCSASRGTEP